MFRYPLLLSLGGLAAALKNPMGVAPILAITKTNKNDSKSVIFEFPPIEVGVQIDFEVSIDKALSRPPLRKGVLVLVDGLEAKKLKLGAASSSITQHKYSTVVWAALLFVWTPLVIVLFCHTFFGKEFLIDILVSILPEQVPARHIEMVIEDGLWVAIFAVCFAATVGAFLVESTALAIDVVKGLLLDSSSGKEKHQRSF